MARENGVIGLFSFLSLPMAEWRRVIRPAGKAAKKPVPGRAGKKTSSRSKKKTKAKDVLGVSVVAVVTDNASNMEMARQKYEDTDVFTYGKPIWEAHMLNFAQVCLIGVRRGGALRRAFVGLNV